MSFRRFSKKIGKSQYLLPCGATAEYDENASVHYGVRGDGHYVCTKCGAIPGSIMVSKNCRLSEEKQQIWSKLGGPNEQF